MAFLTVTAGPDQGQRFEIADASHTVGRDLRNAIRLRDSEASRCHAELRRTDKGYIVYDLQSSNGTFVNGERISSRPLHVGDRIAIGQTELIYTVDPPSQAAELASRIAMIPMGDPSDQSAIFQSLKHEQGSQILRFPDAAGSRWLKDALVNLNVMLETSFAISRISDLDQLLPHILDLVFRTLEADRGCIMLREETTGLLRPTAIHYAREEETQEKINISSTITDWVLEKKEGMLVVDAQVDERLRQAKSVLQMGIREAMCVPLAGRHDVLGVLYVDIKSDTQAYLKTQKPNKFSEEHLKLLLAIAYQAGLAIEDTRYHLAMMQAERLAAVGQTIAMLSHHIKNILQGVRSGSYLIDMGLKDRNYDVLQQGWRIVEKNQGKIYNLVMDMLSYSKDREPMLEPTVLNDVVEEVVELMQPRARDFKANLTSRLDPAVGVMLIDSEGIHRSLLNIVTNAIDATEDAEAGAVTVETSLSVDGNWATITVDDNGAGIADEQLPKLFQIFASTKGARGSGLGLAVSQKIVKEHGGRIDVQSKVAVGSRFFLHLPVQRPGDVKDVNATKLGGVGH